jgi:small subunit ribosomal protein S6
MERFYEVMFIVRPDIEDADVDKLIAGFEQTIVNGGGHLRSTEKLGRRKLAYTVRKFNDGNYVLLTVDADGKLVAELERRLRVSEPVIKFITVRMDEEEKRLNKIKAIRATKKKISAQPAAAAPAATATPVASSAAPVAGSAAPVAGSAAPVAGSAAPAPVESAPAPMEAAQASA